MLTYVDSSAITKLILDDSESRSLATHLTGAQLATSALSQIEVSRAAARVSVEDPTSRVRSVLSVFDVRPLDGDIVTSASKLEPPALRSLDAIHLATALAFGDDLDELVAYDMRLLNAASSFNIRVFSP